MSEPKIVCIKEVHAHEGEEVTLRGWLYNKRSSGKLHFLQLRDGTDACQQACVGEIAQRIRVENGRRQISAQEKVQCNEQAAADPQQEHTPSPRNCFESQYPWPPTPECWVLDGGITYSGNKRPI